MVIHKFVIPGRFWNGYNIALEPDAEIVHVEMVDGNLTFWAARGASPASVFNKVPEEPTFNCRSFQVVGTGHPFHENTKHLGTVIDGRFVWHLLEIL